MKELEYPFDSEYILKKKKSIRKELLKQEGTFLKKKIAVLGGSTTSDMIKVLDLFLLNQGIQAFKFCRKTSFKRKSRGVSAGFDLYSYIESQYSTVPANYFFQRRSEPNDTVNISAFRRNVEENRRDLSLSDYSE